MKTSLRLGLLLSLVCAACDAEEQCVADCDGQEGTGSSTGADPTGSGESGATGSAGALACGEAMAAADAFVLEHQPCESVLDCATVFSTCYVGGATPNDCGTVGLGATADLGVWELLHDDVAEACGCGQTPDCGSAVYCTEANVCASSPSSGGQDVCPSYLQDAQDYLAAHRSCEVDEDCVTLEGSCYVDDCSGVAVNRDADPEDWQRLDMLLWTCAELESDQPPCNWVGECNFEAVCSDEGQCVVGASGE